MTQLSPEERLKRAEEQATHIHEYLFYFADTIYVGDSIQVLEWVLDAWKNKMLPMTKEFKELTE